jgi:hypothetical protein
MSLALILFKANDFFKKELVGSGILNFANKYHGSNFRASWVTYAIVEN